MNLNFDYLDEKIKISNMTVLAIEDVSVFSKVVMEIYQYLGEDDYIKLFDDKYKLLKKTELCVVGEILTFDINSKSNLKLIYQDLEEQLNGRPEVKSEVERLAMKITEIISVELIDHDLDLEQDEITLPEIFVSLGIKVDTQSKSVYEKMLDIIHLYKYLNKQKLLVLINSLSFLTEEEIVEVRNYIQLQNKPVLFIEPRKVQNIKQFALDEDYFLQEI